MQTFAVVRSLVFCATLGCATHGGPGTQGAEAIPHRNLIAESEIATLGGSVNTAYGIVERLRPEMLRLPSGLSADQTVTFIFTAKTPLDVPVYLDSARLGDVRALNDIPRLRVREIRYLPGASAGSVGARNVIAAIQVISKP